MSPAKKTPRKTSKKSPLPKKPAPSARTKPERRPAAKPAPKKAAPAKELPKAKKGVAPAPPAPQKAAAPPGKGGAPVGKGPAPAGKGAAQAAKGEATRAAPAAQEGQKPVTKAAAKDPRKPAKPRARAPVLPDIVKPGLGGRWECYSCGSKFYDLGRPEPTCPKCGADQRDKPREKPSAPTPQPERPRRAAVPMGSLLDEDEEPVEEFEGDDEDLALEDDAFLTETPEAPEEDDEVVDVTTIDED